MLQLVFKALPGDARGALKRSRLYGIYSSARIASAKVGENINATMLPLFAATRLGSAIYYLMFSRKFDREHQSVLKGRAQYLRDIRSARRSSYLLRRNIHRLEKGLSMRPRRPVFATEFIAETIGAYEKVLLGRGDASASEELLWSFDVLHTYFEVTGAHPAIDSARRKFGELSKPLSVKATQFDGLDMRVPFARSFSPANSISYESLLQLAQRRRSVRWFEPRPADRFLVDQAVDVARLSPSACNRLPFSFRVLDDYDLVQKAAALAGGTGGYRQSIRTLVVIVGHLSAYFDERDRHLIYIDASLAAMSFMLAAESLGLSTCAINWSDVEKREKAMASLLGLPDQDRPIMLMAVGYADPEGQVPYSSKKTLNEIRSYNFEDR